MKKLFFVLVVLVVFGFFWYRNRGSRPTDALPTPTPTTSQSSVTRIPTLYKVQKGEGLWIIAERELGSGFKWIEIAKENNLSEPYILYVGQELRIPGKEVAVVTQAEGTYTLTQIAEHASEDNCWLAIDGKVYDVTPFVTSGFHPGKAAILQGCGKDATVLFNTRSMGSGTPHSERARKMLPKYLIGELAE